MKKCLVVLGMHRSGTSALMGMLYKLGVDLGSEQMGPADDNPKGFFENSRLSRLNERLLARLKSSWDDLFILPDNFMEKEDLSDYRHEIEEIIRNEMREKDLFGIKDPRLSLLLPFWNSIFESLNIRPCYIVLVRSPLEVAGSLKKRNGFSIEKSVLLWMKYMLLAEVNTRAFQRVFVHFDELLRNPGKIISDISAGFDINFSKYGDAKGDIEQFLESGLKHHNLNVNRNVLDMVYEFHNSLLSLISRDKDAGEVLKAIDSVRERFFNASGYFYNDEIRANRDGLVESQNAIIKNLEETLTHIYESKGWKSLLFYYNMREKIFPQDSRRMMLLRVLIKFAAAPVRFFRALNFSNIKKFFYYLRTDPSLLWEKVDRKVTEASESWSETLSKIRFDKDIVIEKIEDLVFKEISEPEASIIIPVWNKWIYTYHCLASIMERTKDIPYEVIVVDNASTDETQRLLGKVKNIKVIRNNENLGFVKACNMGAGGSSGKYLVFLNNDTQVTENWLKHLLDLIKERKDVGAVGAKLIYPDGRLQEGGGIMWNDEKNLAWNFGRYDRPDYYEYNYVKEVDYCSGACLLVRRELWERLGGFDLQYAPAYCEDSDLAFGVRRLGYKVMYQPKSEIIHFEGITAGTDISGGIKKFQAINQEKFFNKWKDALEKGHFKAGENVFLARDRSRDKKILIFIDHHVPTWDKDAGSLNMLGHIKIFMDMGYKVIFWPDDLRKREPYTSELQQMGVEVVYGAKSFRRYVRGNGKYFDIAVLSRPDVSIHYFDHIRKYSKAGIIYIGHDLHYLREERRAKVENNPRLLKEVEKWKRKEFYLMENSDVSVVYSGEEERKIKDENPGINVALLPFVQNINEMKKSFDDRKDIVFIGGFDHLPNEDAVLWFTNDIFPLIRRKIPEAEFIVIGSNPTRRVKDIKTEGVVITGYVKDVSPYFQNAKIFVSPLRYGAGMKGKILLAMSYGLPVITTSIGAEGAGLRDNEDAVIADDPKEFAERAVEVYSGKTVWERLSENSIRYVKTHNAPDAAREKIESMLLGLHGKQTLNAE